MDPEEVIAGVVHHHGVAGRDPSTADLNRHAIEVKKYARIGYHYVILELWAPIAGVNNDYTVGICINGNLEEEDITEGQYEALVLLCLWLQEEFQGMGVWYPHCELEAALCPGANFPWERFIRDLGRCPPIC